MKGKTVTRKYSHLIYIPICIVVILLGKTSFRDALDTTFSYIFNPIYIFANSTGDSILMWSKALTGASSYIQEYEDMKQEIARLRVENSEKILDYEEYKALKEQNFFIYVDSKYLESKVLRFDTQGDIVINVGRDEGVKEGDVVVLGKAFVGRVFEVSKNSSLVKLPTNKATSLEVIVVDSSIDLNAKNRVDSFVKARGVVKGEVDNIVIENLGINADIKDGDLILIQDERIGEILILGTLIGISKNPASTSKEGFVSPIFDYSNLLIVFVNIE